MRLALNNASIQILFDKELLLHETAVLRNKVTSLTRQVSSFNVWDYLISLNNIPSQLNVAEEATARLRSECATAARANEVLQSERARMESKDTLLHKKMTLLLNEFEFLKMSCATFNDVIVSTQAQVDALKAQGEQDKAQLAILQRDARKSAAKIATDEQQLRVLQESNRLLRRQLAERQADADMVMLRLAEQGEVRSPEDGSNALAAEAGINRALRQQVAALEKQAIAGALSLEVATAQLLQANKM